MYCSVNPYRKFFSKGNRKRPASDDLWDILGSPPDSPPVKDEMELNLDCNGEDWATQLKKLQEERLKAEEQEKREEDENSLLRQRIEEEITEKEIEMLFEDNIKFIEVKIR